MTWEFAVNGRLLTPEQAASFIPGLREELTRMSTPTVAVVASAPPLTHNHAVMAAKLAARQEAQREAEVIARASSKVRSTPTKIMGFLRSLGSTIKGGAGRAGGWLAQAAAPAAGFIKSIGAIPVATLFATGDKGQATIRWVARSVWGLVSWAFRKAGTFLDGTLRMFGRPGNWLADKLLRGVTKVLEMAAIPVGMAYAVTAPLVSSKSGHVKLINRFARFVVVHRLVRLFVRNPIIAWPLEVFIDLFVIGKMERALRLGMESAEYAAIRLEEAANEAKAKAVVDAHIATQAASNAKVKMDTQASQHMSTPQAMGKIGEQIEKVSKKADEILDNTKTSPTVAASPGVASSGTERSDGEKGGGGSKAEGDQPGQPVESAEELRVRFEAEGKIGQIMVPADTTREEQISAAQYAADKIGEDVVAVLPDGTTAVVEPTGTVVETVIEAEGPEVDEAPMSREARRAAEREQNRQPAKGKAGSGKQRR